LGLPTETVYGLAANADNDTAVARIFTTKGRPADHPLIVHVADASAVAHYAAEVPEFAQALMAAFWPGPLTLILPRRPGVANAAAGGNPTIGLRCPSHPVAQELLIALKKGVQMPIVFETAPSLTKQLESDSNCFSLRDEVWGLAAPSANQFGRVSPTTANHVAGEFGDELLILDGGPCSVGIESTIVDCTRGQPVLLRPGAITPAQVQLACGLKVLLKEELSAQAARAPKASGTLESHYAPRARVRVMAAPELQLALDRINADTETSVAAGTSASVAPDRAPLAIWSHTLLRWPVTLEVVVLYRHMPADAESAARQLFAVLREFDAQGVSQIWIESPPDAPEWDGVRDRLQRAAH